MQQENPLSCQRTAGPFFFTSSQRPAQYNEGPYAYWLAAGIPADRDEALIKNVIELFCTENLAEEEAA